MAKNDWSKDEVTHRQVLDERHRALLGYVNKMNEEPGAVDFFGNDLGGIKYKIDGEVSRYSRYFKHAVRLEKRENWSEDRYNMIVSNLMEIEETLKNVAKQSLSTEEEIKIVNFLKYLLDVGPDSHGYRTDLFRGALDASAKL